MQPRENKPDGEGDIDAVKPLSEARAEQEQPAGEFETSHDAGTTAKDQSRQKDDDHRRGR